MINVMLAHHMALPVGRPESHASIVPRMNVLPGFLVLDEEGLVHSRSPAPA